METTECKINMFFLNTLECVMQSKNINTRISPSAPKGNGGGRDLSVTGDPLADDN